MPKIWVAPVGKLVSGHVLDCSKRALEEALRKYDVQLYLKWEPKKLRGEGAWELRRKPEHKRPLESLSFQGNTITVLGYKENHFENHVKDFAFLNYKILEWVKDNDQWRKSYKAKNFMADLEYNEAKAQEAHEDRTQADREYNLKQHKSQIRDLMSYVSGGGNPADFAKHWGK